MPVRVFMGHGGPLPTKAWWETINESDPFDALEEWSKCVNAARLDIDKYIQTWRNEMDTFLVFGALYSAIVTAFLIDSYKWLQLDSTDATVTLLLHVSAQLADATQPAASSPSYSPTSAQVGINILWFASLVISLTGILLAIMIKQWLSEYTSPAGTSSPRHTLAIRQARVDALKRWHINTIVDWLPMFFISSLFLFFAGLATLLYTYSTVVGSVTIGLVSIPFLIFITTSILPTFFSSCSYRSVQAYLATVILGPVLALITGRRLVWTIRDAWESGAKRARVEPRALLWILRTICPWTPSLYPAVSICTRSLDPILAPRAVCDLYRYSILDENVRFTKVQARRWQLLIGTDEFEKTCSLLADGAQSMPGGPGWQGVEAEDLIDYVKTMALFFTLFSPEYLSKGRRYEEFHPAPIFRKGLKVLIEIATGDKLPKGLPIAQQDELEGFVLSQLEIINDFAWPTYGDVAQPPSELLSPLTNAAIRAQNNHSPLFVTLSTLAMGITRRMSVADFQENRDQIASLLRSMAAFIKDSSASKDTSSHKGAMSRWMAVLFDGCGGDQDGSDSAIDNWDLDDAQIRREILNLIDTADHTPFDIWDTNKKHRYRLLVDFGDAEDIARAYLESACLTEQSHDPWSKEHRDLWKARLTQVEGHRAVGSLLKSVPRAPGPGTDCDTFRVLLEALSNCDSESALVPTGISKVLDVYLSGRINNDQGPDGTSPLSTHIVQSLSRIFYDVYVDHNQYYFGDKTNAQLTMSLEAVLGVLVREDKTSASLLTTPITAAVLETLTCIHESDFPGQSLLRLETAQLFQALQRVVAQKEPFVGDLVVQWIKALRMMKSRDIVFFGADEEKVGTEVRKFLQLIQGNPDIMSNIVTDSEAYLSFKVNCSCFSLRVADLRNDAGSYFEEND